MLKRRKSERRWWWSGAAVVMIAAMAVGCTNEREDRPQRPSTAEFRLSPAQSCDDVRDQVATALTEQILQWKYEDYWWGGWDDVDFAAPEGEAGDDGGGRADAPSEFTDTNVQEAGVDEPDLVKTDGRYIYVVADGSLQILTSWPPEDTARVSRHDFGSNVYPSSLFLRGDLVAVFSYMYGERYYYNDGAEPRPDSDDPDVDGGSDGQVDGAAVESPFSGTRITLLDVSDRTSPEVVRQLDVEGHFVSGRMIGDQVHVVTNSGLRGLNAWSFYSEEIDGLPERDWNETEDELEVMREQARPLIYAHVRSALDERDPAEWLPRQQILDGDDQVVLAGSLYECTDLYIPQVNAQLGVLNVSSFTMADDAEFASTGLLANGWQVYASQQNLYIAMSSRSWWWWGWGDQTNESHIHKFTFTNSGPQYIASGRVDGWILNQFSFSEHNGHLRVATTDNRWAHNPQTGEFEDQGGNHVIVLKAENGELVETGSVRDLAPTERVYSARFMGDRGYVVTFRETDPFYTLDLSDPTNPQMIGELKIEGFSSYMHPLDENHLLAIGRDGDENGFMTGVHLQVFDVTDMADPVRTQHYVISTGGWSSDSEAMWNHLAFTYQPRLGILAVPMNIWENDDRFTGLMLFDATKDGISEIGRIDHGDLAAQSWCASYGQSADCEPESWWQWWSQMRRSIMMSGEDDSEEFIYSISSVGLKVNLTFDTDTELASVLWR